jgi:hypothetical protein
VLTGLGESIALGLLVLAALVAGLTSTWRGARVALLVQYLGAAFFLLAARGGVAALLTLIVGGASVLILTPGVWALGPELRQARQRLPDVAIDWFDLSVIALGLVGAAALAVTHPLPDVGEAAVAVDVLVLVGLLCCVLGPFARVAVGLLFLVSAGSLLFQTADLALVSGDLLLLSLAPLALAVALANQRTREADADGGAENDLATAPRKPLAAGLARDEDGR